MTSIDPNDEIVHDFLVEVGEVMDGLSAHLVRLESCPGDVDRQDAIFRGFHTIKGGASFLGLGPLVAVSREAEDAFAALRRGERDIDAVLMDVVLRVFAVLYALFEDLRGTDGLGPAPAVLLEALRERCVTVIGDLVLTRARYTTRAVRSGGGPGVTAASRPDGLAGARARPPPVPCVSGPAAD